MPSESLWVMLKKHHLQWFIPIAIALILIAVYVLPIFYQNSNTAQSNKNQFSSENMIKLHGNVPYIISNETCSKNMTFIQKAPGTSKMALTLYLNYTNLSLLEKYAYELNNPTSINFHKYLTPEEFRREFDPNNQEIRAIENYYERAGFTVWNYSYAPNIIVVDGSISLIEEAFNVTEYCCEFKGNNKLFITNKADPWIPRNFFEIYHIYGLSYSSDALYPLSNSLQEKLGLRGYDSIFNITGNSYTLIPNNIYSYYNLDKLLKNGSNGEGIKIGILGVGESVDMNCVENFWNAFGISNPDTKLINLTSSGGNSYPQGFEADLDVEWAGAMAPNATICDVMQPFNLTGIGDNAVNLELYYMLNVVDPNIVSGSWAELQFHHDQGFADIYNNIGLQAVVEGITIFLGSGDSHDLNYLTVMGSKYIVTVGGIHPELNSSGEIVNQYAWYNPSGEWYGGPTGSGGGQSYFFPIPGFEKNYSIRVNGTNNMEGLPDLSMPASELITFGLGEYMTGDGTSYATPILAGMMASIESGISKDRNLTSRLGWIQPMLFNLSYGKVWGNNSYMNVSYTEPGSWVGSDMYLGTGWNAYTGIGSINAYNLYIDIKNYESQ